MISNGKTTSKDWPFNKFADVHEYTYKGLWAVEFANPSFLNLKQPNKMHPKSKKYSRPKYQFLQMREDEANAASSKRRKMIPWNGKDEPEFEVESPWDGKR